MFYVLVLFFAATPIGFCSYDSNKIAPIKLPTDSKLQNNIQISVLSYVISSV